MIWLTFRQQRLETLIGGAVLAVIAALLLVTGFDMIATLQHTGAAACLARHAQDATCQAVESAFQGQYNALTQSVSWLNFLPPVFGILLAAPFVLEIEQGTYRLIWTQGITRMRWATIKLGLIVVGAVAVSLVLSLLMGWWHGPMDQLQGQFSPNSFDFEGIVPVAYTVYAVALGLAVGTVLRRTIPAMAVTLIGFLGLRGLLEVVRAHYLPPVVQAVAAGSRPLGRSDWVLDQGLQDRGGHAVRYLDAVRLCGSTHGGGLDGVCLRHHGILQTFVYQPASRLGLFQGIEAAIFLGLAAGLLVLTLWWIRYRLA